MTAQWKYVSVILKIRKEKKKSISDDCSSNAALSTTFYTPWTAQRPFSTLHEHSHHGTRHIGHLPLVSAGLAPLSINIPPPSHRHFASLAHRPGLICCHA